MKTPCLMGSSIARGAPAAVTLAFFFQQTIHPRSEAVGKNHPASFDSLPSSD
jgi:hypothetical protein